MQKQPENVNIYLSQTGTKEKVLSNSSPYEKYIILMNDTLQTENRSLNDKVKDLQSQIDKNEEDIDNYDTSKRYTKGLLKNLVVLEQLRSKIANNNKETYTTYRSNLLLEYKKNRILLRTFESIVAILFAVIYRLRLFSIVTIFMLGFVFVFQCGLTEYILVSYKNVVFVSNNNSELEEKIKKINDSQDFLNEYIENI